MPLLPDPEAPPAQRISPLLAWLTRQRETVDLELACAEHPGPERGLERHTVAQLPCCLAELPHHVFLELLTCGAEHVYPRLDGCAHAEAMGARLDHLASLVDALGHEGRLRAMIRAPKGRRRPVMDATHVPLSRRQVLLLSGARTRRDMPAEYRSAQERLADAVRALAPDPTPAAAALPSWAVTLAAPACTACGMCVRTCPEDALSLTDLGVAREDAGAGGVERDDGRARRVVRLRQAPSRCTGCLACVEACPVPTLRATGAWAATSLWADEPVPVVDVLTRRCARCGARVPVSPGPDGATAEVLCGQCAFRRENPFGSALPPEALARLDPEVVRKLGYEPPDH